MKRRILIGSGLAALAILLAGAAFVGGRLLNAEGLQLPNGQVLHFGFGSGQNQHCDLSRIPAPEVPGPPMMRRAILVRRENNSLFIGVPLRGFTMQPGGTVSQTNEFDGPIVEVVVTHDTKVYQDVTFRNYNGACGKIQEVVVPGTLDDIVADTTFLVWGQRTGDRILASHLVYELPPVRKPTAP